MQIAAGAQPTDLAKTLSFGFNNIQFSNALALMTQPSLRCILSSFRHFFTLFVVTITHSPFTFHIQNELMLSFIFHSALCFSHSLI